MNLLSSAISQPSEVYTCSSTAVSFAFPLILLLVPKISKHTQLMSDNYPPHTPPAAVVLQTAAALISRSARLFSAEKTKPEMGGGK